MNPAVILPCLVQDLVEAQQQLFEEHHDFYEAQQDCEKWLLQMSFRLMAHNSLNVSSMELTERQIEKHRVGRSATCSCRALLYVHGVGRSAHMLLSTLKVALLYVHRVGRSALVDTEGGIIVCTQGG